MGLFSFSQREGKGVGKNEPIPPKPILYSRIFFSNFLDMMKLNLLFILFCLPIVTIGPAIAGFTYVLTNYIRGVHVFMFSDFFEYFKKAFVKSFAVCLIDTLIIYSIFIGIINNNMGNMVIPIVVAAVIILFINFYVFNLIVTYKFNLLKSLNFSFLLAIGNLPINILIVIVLVAIGFILLKINIVISILLLIIPIPVVVGYLILCFTDEKTRKIIDRYAE